MLGELARIMLTATAIAPVSLTYAFVALYQRQLVVAACAASAGVILTVFCIRLLKYVRRQSEALPFSAEAIEPADSESLGFMLLNLLPLFTDDISALNWELWVPLIALFGIMTSTGYSYHFNPLLGLRGWHFYEVTSKDGVTYVLITRKHLRTAAGVHPVAQLTEYMLIDLEG